MFITFFYLLREKGLNVSINEWFSLIEALDKGLCSSSLIHFYRLCRGILIKSEVDYDKFDQAFAEYFRDVRTPEEIPDQVWNWLDKELGEMDEAQAYEMAFKKYELDELREMLNKRLCEQKEEHNGGNYWVGTGGTSVFGHSGYNPAGIRIGGKSRHKSAVKIAGERNFKDFRQDTTLEIRHFQMAFRKLRQFSSRLDGPKTELNLEETINETCDNAGNLKLVWERPRQNTVKLLLLFDSDGSMFPYMNLCNRLFHAVNKSNHFKDLKVYYFHNCIYEHLYTGPSCRRGRWVDTEWVFNNLGSDYRVVLVGDGTMAPSELMNKGGNNYVGLYNQVPGIEWLKSIKKKYPHSIWLNPIPEYNWPYTYGEFTLQKIREIFPMFELTIDGLDAGIKKLMVRR